MLLPTVKNLQLVQVSFALLPMVVEKVRLTHRVIDRLMSVQASNFRSGTPMHSVLMPVSISHPLGSDPKDNFYSACVPLTPARQDM